MTEIEIRALEIARDDFELKLWAAEKHAEAAAKKRRKLERRRQLIGREADAESQREALLDLPSDEWLLALTGVEMPTGRRVSCPLPGHEDSEPSCRFYASTFYCFSCGRGGDVFRFAGELWGVSWDGRSFATLRKRLVELLL
jgi:hypothetical protein